MTEDAQDRITGTLLGLAAGDRIGGPLRMALRMAESLSDCGGFDVADIGNRYLDWWKSDAFDTGSTTASVLSRVASGFSFEMAATLTDTEASGKTAGCNPAHRVAPLAMCSSIKDEELAIAAITETRLTHRHRLAADVSAAVARLCRLLICGSPWPAALAMAAENRHPETRHNLTTLPISSLSISGYAPDTLGAAIYFLNTSDSFSGALDRAVNFAGPANYCAVLVGSIGGARWGRNQIDEASFEHQGDIIERVRAVAFDLSTQWADTTTPSEQPQ